ncbi:Type 1 glutamine amidotransferase-like domain-containing protein [Nonomuraea sp. NPDC052634]|uniref:Type 1 glutamine amidotransferase-like domain-containing protein n=1 Tax=Nonomuraea sp. NPDC052634 TaxID=3155813 RepID=UPI00341DDED4
MIREPQILACSGALYPPADYRHPGAQIWQAMRLADVRRPRVCLIATATGDSREHITGWYERAGSFGDAELSHLTLFTQPNVPDVRAHLRAQDVIFVSGGSVVNLLAVWRAHRLEEILRECWESGVVLAGQSAGSLCWHLGGVTDSFGDRLDVVADGLAFLPFSNGVHEDGVALHYVGTRLHEAVAVLPERHACFIEPGPGGSHRETAIPARLWMP